MLLLVAWAGGLVVVDASWIDGGVGGLGLLSRENAPPAGGHLCPGPSGPPPAWTSGT